MSTARTIKINATPRTLQLSPDRPSWLDRTQYPFDSHFVDLGGSRVHYIDEGAGPTILFLHAAPSWSFIYRNFIKDLRADFRCIALDYPGFGLSPEGRDSSPSLGGLSKIVESFVGALELRDITLMVHDSSGPIGLGAAARQPNLYKALIITDTFAWPLTQYPRVQGFMKVLTSPLFDTLNARFNLLPKAVSSMAARRRKLAKPEIDAYLCAFPTARARRRIIGIFRELIADVNYLNGLEMGLSKLTHLPALIMYGEHDPARQAGWQERFETMFKNNQSVVIKGEGHFPHEGAPEEMIASIRAWWGSILADASR